MRVVYVLMTITMLASLVQFSIFIHIENGSWPVIPIIDYLTDPDLTHQLQDNLRNSIRRVGLSFGIQYFVICILLIIVMIKLFRLLREPRLLRVYQSLGPKERNLKCMAIFLISTQLIRSFLFCIFGIYYTIIKSSFVRYELYIILSTLLEVPNLFLLYITHYFQFKDSNLIGAPDLSARISLDVQLDPDELDKIEWMCWSEPVPISVLMTSIDLDFVN